MMVSKINKNKQELLVKNEPSPQSNCNNNTSNDTCQDKGHEEVIYINTELYKIPGFHPLSIISQKRLAEKYGLKYYKNLTYGDTLI